METTILFLDYYGNTIIHELEVLLLLLSEIIKFCFLSRKSTPLRCNPTELEIIMLIKSCFLTGHTFPASSLQATPTFLLQTSTYFCYRQDPMSKWHLHNLLRQLQLGSQLPNSFLVFPHKQLTLLFVDISMSTTLHKFSNP